MRRYESGVVLAKRTVDDHFIVTTCLIHIQCGHCPFQAYTYDTRVKEMVMRVHRNHCEHNGQPQKAFQLRLDLSSGGAKGVGR